MENNRNFNSPYGYQRTANFYDQSSEDRQTARPKNCLFHTDHRDDKTYLNSTYAQNSSWSCTKDLLSVENHLADVLIPAISW